MPKARRIAGHLLHGVHAKKERHRFEAAAYFIIIIIELWTALVEGGVTSYLYRQVSGTTTIQQQQHHEIEATFHKL